MTIEEYQKKYFILNEEEMLNMINVWQRLPTPVGSWLEMVQKWPTFGYVLESMRSVGYQCATKGGAACPQNWTVGQYSVISLDSFDQNLVIPNFTYDYASYMTGFEHFGGSVGWQTNYLQFFNAVVSANPMLAVILMFVWAGGRDTTFGWADSSYWGFDPSYFFANGITIAGKIRAVDLYGVEMITQLNEFKLASDQRLLSATQESEARINEASRDALLLEREAVTQVLDYEVAYQFALDNQMNQMALLNLQLEAKLDSMM